jgi:hypothetical protein
MQMNIHYHGEQYTPAAELLTPPLGLVTNNELGVYPEG